MTLEQQLVLLQYDIEQFKAVTIRKIEAEIELLEVGLSALRRTPAKIHVMDDHADRAIAGLKKTIELLERN
jgi:hypothetical protein